MQARCTRAAGIALTVDAVDAGTGAAEDMFGQVGG